MIDLKKRYWLISYNYYYPDGGLNDIKATHRTKKEAQAAYKEELKYRKFDDGYDFDVILYDSQKGCNLCEHYDNKQSDRIFKEFP